MRMLILCREFQLQMQPV